MDLLKKNKKYEKLDHCQNNENDADKNIDNKAIYILYSR